MGQKITSFFNITLILNIFMGGVLLLTSPFEFYLGYIFILFFLLFYILHYDNLHSNSSFLIIMLILTLSSLVNIYFGKNTFPLMTKQVLGILITGIAYNLLIKINKNDIDRLFKIYLRIAFFVSVIGIFQEISYITGFKMGYDYSWILKKWYVTTDMGGLLIRVNSVFLEPSHYAISMAPAFFVALLNVFRRDSPYSQAMWGIWGSLIIILSYILTFSAMAYLAIIISLLFLCNVKRPRNLLILSLIIPILIYAAYCFIPEIRSRIDSIIGLVTGSKKIGGAHFSLYTYASNGFVMCQSFMDSPLFGHGFGSHPVSYDAYIHTNGRFMDGYPEANKMDASSLLLRLLSETGLFGTIAVFYFIFRFRLKISTSHKNNLQIINNSILILFVLQLLKQGHYFYNGLFFFVWMYYFSHQRFFSEKVERAQC